MASPLCIIPARGGSKRLRRKNIALLAGKPLLAYAIDAAAASGVFDRICVSSDDEEILSVVRCYGADEVLKRDSRLATDTATVVQVCLHLLREFDRRGCRYDTLGVLLPTSPLRTSDDVRAAYALLDKHEANYALSLVPFSHPPQHAFHVPQGLVEPYQQEEYLKSRQQLETLYRHDGVVAFARRAAFEVDQDLCGDKVVPYFTPEERAVDIDNPLDLAWAEFLLEKSRRAVA